MLFKQKDLNTDIAISKLTDIAKKKELLFGYIEVLNKTDFKLEDIPRTTNLIELYNSHIQSRLKSIKGFKSFKTANIWLNGYFLRRRTKHYTDCSHKFKHINNKCSTQLSAKDKSTLNSLKQKNLFG